MLGIGDGMMELIKSISIEALLIEYERNKNALTDMHDRFHDYINASQFCDFEACALGGSRYRHTGFLTRDNNGRKYGLDLAINRLRAAYWEKLMNESGMKTFMGSKAILDWDDMIREPSRQVDLPELNKDTIQSTFEALHKDKGVMFNKSVLDLFKSLSWSYKTNLPHKLGKRVIIGYLNTIQTGDKINDLEKALMVADNKNIKDRRDAIGSVAYYSHWSGGKVGVIAENEYLSIKAFQNHNAHITFKRPELVDRLNKIIALAYPNALPPIK